MGRLCALFVVLVCLATGCVAGPLYSSLGPGNTYPSSQYVVPHTSWDLWQAVVFTATGSGNLGDVLVPIGEASGLPLSFSLYAGGDNQPGALLESWTNVAVTTNNVGVPLLDLTSVLNPFVSAGSVYWFVAYTPAPGGNNIGNLFWNQSSLSGTDTSYQSYDGSTWNGPYTDSTMYALQLDSTVPADSTVPEPATYALFGCGLIGLAVCRRKISAWRSNQMKPE